MRRFIHKLRQKPKSTRRKIALGTSASVTGLIFIIWLTIIVQGGVVSSVQQDPQAQTASPVSAIKGNASAAFSSLQNRLQGESGTTSAASANIAAESSSSTQSTTSDKKLDNSGNTQRIEREPYWQANDGANQNQEASQQNFQEDSDNFWQDQPNSNNDSGGWF